MEYKELMHFLETSEGADSRAIHSAIFPAIFNFFFKTPDGEIRCILYDLPEPIGRDIKCFTISGKPKDIATGKDCSDMCFMEYVKFLIENKTPFWVTVDKFEEFKSDLLLVIIGCEWGCEDPLDKNRIREEGEIEGDIFHCHDCGLDLFDVPRTVRGFDIDSQQVFHPSLNPRNYGN
jgi:hypothetical protein